MKPDEFSIYNPNPKGTRAFREQMEIDNNPNNQHQEKNLETLRRLKAIGDKPEDIKRLLLEMAAEDGHPGDLRIPMPNYDPGVVLYKNYLLELYEGYLKRVGAIK